MRFKYHNVYVAYDAIKVLFMGLILLYMNKRFLLDPDWKSHFYECEVKENSTDFDVPKSLFEKNY